MRQMDRDRTGLGSGVVLSGECRPLRQTLRPVTWVILEEVALDAVDEDGRLVARTSARRVAEQLGVNPTTAAEALRVLARRGLVSLERETGPAGRFGLSVYQLFPPAGLCVVQPCAVEPFMVSPSMVKSELEEPDAGSPSVEAPAAESSHSAERGPRRAGRPDVGADTDPIVVASDPDSSTDVPGGGLSRRPGRSMGSPGSSPHCTGQETLDFGWGSSS